MLTRRDLLNLVPASSLAWLWGAEAQTLRVAIQDLTGAVLAERNLTRD
jgi:hypothetical protein